MPRRRRPNFSLRLDLRALARRVRGALRRGAMTLRRPRHALALAVLLIASAISLVRCTSPAARSGLAPSVQVLLDRDVNAVRVGVDGEFAVENGRGAALASGKRLVDGQIRATGDGFDMNGVQIAGDEVVLHSRGGAPFTYGGKSYPGGLRLRRSGNGRLEVANVLDIEDYVAGVLFSEMPATFPTEALKAQAVAARTYARYRLDHGDPLLRSTDADQVYGGSGPRYAQARELVEATRGLVLEVNGKTLCSYFMSTCGGATMDAPLVFPSAGKAGLVGVPCDWCRESPKYRWTRTLALSEFERRLGFGPGTVNAIAARRDGAGHSVAFDVSGLGGSRSFSGQEFRRLWNAKAASDAEKLPSFWLIDLDVSRQAVTVQGAGFGHGVGLCQFGAAGLAKAGRDWRAILQHYYRGAELVRRW